MVEDSESLKLFKSCCIKWLTFFGLKNYEATFDFLDSDNESKACVIVDVSSRMASFNLEPSWIAENPSEEEVDRTAFHEVTHVLLGRLCEIAQERFIGHNEIAEAEHELIRILEGTVFETMRKSKKRKRKKTLLDTQQHL